MDAKDLQDWQAAWTMNNESITCSACGAQQPSRYANADFIHAPGCACASHHQRPWEALMSILILPAPTPEVSSRP